MIQKAEGTKIESLEPRPVWDVFAGILRVPRPSKHEEKIRAHILGLAKEKGLKAKEDGVGNIVVDVPATKGHEKAPLTVLQAHLDMVCEKTGDSTHDFDQEGIHAFVDRDPASGEAILRARGTTLGADNGIGVALAFAAATDKDVVHGPLELLFTIDEEAGMTGAKALTPQSFRGRRMLNLDSEEDDRIYIGCAGGCDTNLTWRFDTAPVEPGYESAEVVISGLRGGHSGCDIHEGRSSAIKLLARILSRCGEENLRIVRVSGGSKRNAIPRDAAATVCGPKSLFDRLARTAEEVRAESAAESFEPSAKIEVRKAADGDAASAMSASDTQRLLDALLSLPHGVLGMHPRVPGLVESSNNISTIASSKNGSSLRVEVGTLSRSSSDSRIAEVLAQIEAVARLSGASVERANDYPGWAPNPQSPTLEIARNVYKELFDNDPEVAAIHAGLECGIIGKRVGEMDMISIGPRITGAHTPEECVFIPSVEKSWQFLSVLLRKLAAG
ncbi:MAG: aminoacyl-histidine dipeptidase [Phycisphaerae bacterium]|nr:aminoacyl-histidine dipeptidase [Phycisphaerae bacterium]